jgi:hypothetical protein
MQISRYIKISQQQKILKFRKFIPYSLTARLLSVGICSRGANVEPILVHPQYNFALIFTPKSACSSVVIWFFNTLGVLDEARAFSHWPHHYRIKKLLCDKKQIKAQQQPLANVKILRVVRDPIDRAASSFRHAVGTGYANQRIMETIKEDVEKKGLSFQRFIDFLEMEDLDRCNPHHRRQKNPIEDLRPPDYTINISRQNLFEALNDFEKEMGMPITNFSSINWIHELQATRVPDYLNMGPNPDELVLKMEQAQRGPWPTGLLTPRAKQRLESLYAEDIDLYASAPK